MSEAFRAQLARWRADRMAFRCEAIVLEDGRRLGDVLEPWQAEDFRALDDPCHRHAYLGRPRGHSKTGDVGTEAVAELVLGRPGAQLYVAAVDDDQAALLHADVAGKFRRSPVLGSLVKITRRSITVRATDSTLTVLSSDAPSAYGLRPDWIAVDELAEWRRRELWDALWTATGKRAWCRMLVTSTAGWDRTSIAREVWSLAQTEPDWYYSDRGPCASWITDAWREQQRRTLPAHTFARLHLNQWVEGTGAFLLETEVGGIFTETVPTLNGPAVFGLDLGLAKDRTVLACVRGAYDSPLVAVESLLDWTPRPGARVDLVDVEATVATLARAQHATVVVDPWQGVLLAQRLRARGIRVIEYAFTGESRRKLFGSVLDLVRAGRLRCRPHEALRRELLGLEVQETSVGWRVDHRVGQHDDYIVAVALAAQEAAQVATRGKAEMVKVRGTAYGGFDWSEMDREDERRRARWALRMGA